MKVSNKSIIWLLSAMLFMVALFCTPAAIAEDRAVIVIHGGAGVEANLSPAEQDVYHRALARALETGFAVYQQGGAGVEIVEATIRSMEDDPLFNAGKGAVFTIDGNNELDASIMEGKTRQAGAVAGVTVVKNPISAAIAVMRQSPHVMLAGAGADQFAKEKGLEIVDRKYFWTQARWSDLEKKRQADKSPPVLKKSGDILPSHKFGTVGTVALDKQNNLAAGTSTGGLTGKRSGRVGDSPVIGAGTFADNACCAVSCTGEGEWFIRFNAASDVAARMKYQHDSVATAANAVIHKVLGPGHGEGGLIALDRHGRFAMPFNDLGMLRGYIGVDGKARTFIY